LYAPYVTNYSYDTLDNLTQVNQLGDGSQAARVRTFTYNSIKQLLTAQNPESGLITYSYDPAGNMLQKISPQANQLGSATTTISYCYDSLNRLAAKAYTNSPATPPTCATASPYLPNPAATYTYDQGANAIGHLSSLTDQAGSASYNYDALGRMATEQRTIAGNTKSMSYGYNLDGSLAKLVYPSNATVTYTPDSAGHVLSAVDTNNNINYATGASYDPAGGLTGFVSGGTIINSFSYNKRLQPVNMSATSPSATIFSLNYDFHFGVGDNGDVFAIVNNKDNTRNQSFTYDPINRLATAQNNGTDCSQTTLNGKTKFWGNSYIYDAWGNLVGKTNLPTPKCSPESLDVTADTQNRLHVKFGADYQYDAAGNMTYHALSAQNYSYDAENRITGANGFTYTYDGDGNRVGKSNGTTGTLYWYMAPGVVAESDASGNLQSEYVFFHGGRIARRDNPTGTGSVFYYFSDHLKTTDIVTGAQGNIKNESDFYPFGGELQFSNSDSNHYKFTGKERDSETALDYFGARYYSSALGRFITSDWAAKATAVPYAEFADPQSLNLYTYVRDIPTTRFDADGHEDGKSLGDKLWDRMSERNAEFFGRLPFEVLSTGLKIIRALGSGPPTGPPSPFPQPGLAPNACRVDNQNKNNNNDQNNNNSKSQNTSGNGSSKPASDKSVDLTDAKAKTHILDGDATGGGHRAGTGISGKSEFPASWSDEKILHEISDVTTDPASKVTLQGNTTIYQGTRDGVDLKVIYRDGRIVTGYPTNVPRNP
jgi:RHS repeat-associated protein